MSNDGPAGEIGGMYFTSYHLDPQSNLTMEELVKILKCLDLHFTAAAFERVPEEVRKHFVIHDRYGQRQRYGRRQRR